jgi:DNA-binding winged helix-turn-helix (wHTH) protein
MNAELLPVSLQEFQKGSNGTSIPPSRYIRFGMYHLDLRKEELLKEGVHVKLQGKVYQALLALLEKPGEVVTREALRMRLWPADTHVNYDANVNTTVNKLRQVLGDSPEQPVFVDTIPRKGYSFVAKIEYVDQPAPPPSQSETFSLAASDNVEQEPMSFFSPATLSSKWFTAGVISLVVAGMLLGVALILYLHRGI